MPDSRRKLRNVGRVFATTHETNLLLREIALKRRWGRRWSARRSGEGHHACTVLARLRSRVARRADNRTGYCWIASVGRLKMPAGRRRASRPPAILKRSAALQDNPEL